MLDAQAKKLHSEAVEALEAALRLAKREPLNAACACTARAQAQQAAGPLSELIGYLNGKADNATKETK